MPVRPTWRSPSSCRPPSADGDHQRAQIATAASLLEGTSVQLIGGRLASGGGAVGAEALAQVQRLRADVYLPGPARWTATPACGQWMRKKPR
jgi:hypothetical protein